MPDNAWTGLQLFIPRWDVGSFLAHSFSKSYHRSDQSSPDGHYHFDGANLVHDNRAYPAIVQCALVCQVKAWQRLELMS